MTQNEVSAIVKGISLAVYAQVHRSLGEFSDRIKAIEDRVASVRDGAQGPAGPQGERGEDGIPGNAGADGAAGAPGRDADEAVVLALQSEVKALRDELVTVKAQPPDASEPFDMSDVEALVIKAVAALPAPKDGRDGVDGAPGVPGRDGRDGMPGPAGEKGADGLHGLDGVPGVNGKDGAPGLNGTLDELEVRQSEDLRTVRLCFKATGELIAGGVLTFPVVLDRGVYKAGTTYAAGDGVTWAGSFWIAQRETSDKPGEGQTGWRLAVKRGGDGKPGPEGKPGLNGKDGAPGRDGHRTW